MKKNISIYFLILFSIFIIRNSTAQHWEAKLIAVHPTGIKDTIWFGIDSNATEGYDAGLDSINTDFQAPLGMRIFDNSLYQSGYPPANLRKSYKPFTPTNGYSDTITFTFFVGTDSLPDGIPNSDSVNNLWFTSDTIDFITPYYIDSYLLYNVSIECLTCNICSADGEGFGIYSYPRYQYGCDFLYHEPLIPLAVPYEYQNSNFTDFCSTAVNNDCEISKLEISVLFFDTVWLNNLSVEKKFELETKVYPNPFSNTVKVDFDTKNKSYIVNDIKTEVYDIYGKQINTEVNITNNQLELNLLSKPQGIYFLKIHDIKRNISITKKIQKL